MKNRKYIAFLGFVVGLTSWILFKKEQFGVAIMIAILTAMIIDFVVRKIFFNKNS